MCAAGNRVPAPPGAPRRPTPRTQLRSFWETVLHPHIVHAGNGNLNVGNLNGNGNGTAQPLLRCLDCCCGGGGGGGCQDLGVRHGTGCLAVDTPFLSPPPLTLHHLQAMVRGRHRMPEAALGYKLVVVVWDERCCYRTPGVGSGPFVSFPNTLHPPCIPLLQPTGAAEMAT